MTSRNFDNLSNGDLERHSQASQTSHTSAEDHDTQFNLQTATHSQKENGLVNQYPATHSVQQQQTPNRSALASVAQQQSPVGNVELGSKTSRSSASPPTMSVQGYSTEEKAGKKRTANGTVKPQKNFSVADHTPSFQTGANHSRNTSVNSTASSIGELSLALKTRLTHAMIKLQHDHAKHGTNASPTTSPISTSSTAHGNQETLRPHPSSNLIANHRSRDLSHLVDRQTRSPRDHQLETAQQSSNLLPSKDRPGMRPLGHTTPSLAPAPDIVSSSASRRTRPLDTKSPQPLHITRPSLPSNSSTPVQPARPPSTPTPQEQDAVDTLLFMSSPANSANFPRNSANSSQASPRKSQFVSSTREVLHPALANGAATPRLKAQTSNSSSSEVEPQQFSPREIKRRSMGVSLATEKDVDHLLDQMAQSRDLDNEDASDIIHVPSYSNKQLLNTTQY